MAYAQREEHRAELWLRLEELKRTVDDVENVFLVLSNMARYRGDLALKQLAEDLKGMHNSLSGQHRDVMVAIRQCLVDNYEAQRPALHLVR